MTVIIDGSASAEFETPLPLTEGGTGAVSAAAAATAIAPIQLQTAVASTSGTSIDFTGIPSWVKRITVMFQNVSSSGTSNWQIQLGTASSIETTGYQAVSTYGPALGTGTITTGFPVYNDGGTNTKSGALTFSLLNSSTNIWVCSGNVGQFVGSANYTMNTCGDKTLSGVLTRLRLTTVNGTDAFDAGSINISWEF